MPIVSICSVQRRALTRTGYDTKKLQYGTLGIAYHNPDLFAAVVMSAGDLNRDAYRPTWLGHNHQYALQYAFPLRLREMPILWADNLVNTPTWVTTSAVNSSSRNRIQLYYMLDKTGNPNVKILHADEVKRVSTRPAVFPCR